MNSKIIGILICTLFIGMIFNPGINAEFNANIVTNFNTNLEGWTIEGDGTAIRQSCVGGGFMKIHDNGQSIQILAVAPSKFLGNWSNYNKISIDEKRIFPTTPDESPIFYISGPSGSAYYQDDEHPGMYWMTCEVLLQESYWTVTSGSWNNIISNVASFKIDVELDDSGEEEFGVDNIILYRTGGENQRPNTPSNPSPKIHSIGIDINADLSWIGGDPDSDDTVKYDVYFEAENSTPDVLVSYHQSDVSYIPGTMNYNTKYYWRIVAVDNHGDSITGPIWDFTTSSEPNNPPYLPSNPHPENVSINIATDVVLTWSGGDSDVGDTVTYDVYFGGMPPIQKIVSNISNSSYNPGNLVNDLTYFWSIVAWDNHGESIVGPIWYFTTINPDNNPPYKPSKPVGQKKGEIGQNYSYTTSITDPEGDQLYYNWSWGDGTYSGWIGPYYSGENVNESHSWTDKGNYNIKVKSKDIFGAESDWSDPLAIRMPKTYIYNPIIQQLYKMLERFPFFEKILNQYYYN
jgi:hypothetical protein